MEWLFSNQVLVYFVAAAIIFGLTQGLKWAFVKPFTNKIKNERVRKAVNTVIYFIPYSLGLLFEFVYAVLLAHGEFSVVSGLIHGTAGIAFYGVVERFYAVWTGKSSNISNPYTDTEIGRAVKKLMDGIIEDGKVDEDDHPKLKEFLEKVK